MNLTLAQNRVLRLAAMCALYVAQGLPYGFVTVTLAAYLADRGATTGEIGGLIALAMLPWSFKFAWGPLLDRFSRSKMGRRRPWILIAQSAMVLAASALIAIPSLRDDARLLGWVVFAINVCASLQDVSVDALAVDLLPESERGVANGMMYGASYLGVMLGGAGLSTVVGRHGLRAGLVLQVVVLLIIMMVPLLLRERPGDRMLSLRARPRSESGPSAGSAWELIVNLYRAFARRSPLVGALLALTIMGGSQAVDAISTVLLMKKLGWTQEEYGQMIGGLPLLFGLAGSVGGGWIADRIGHRRAIAIASVGLGLTWIAFALAESAWPIRSFMVVMSCAGQMLLGTLSASLFALYMDVSWPRVAATQFTAYMALLNFGRSIASRLAGPIQDSLGIVGSYLLLGSVQIGVVVLLLFIDPHQNRRELGESEPEPEPEPEPQLPEARLRE